jgi:autotransporter-associated beta strand protein
MNHLEKSAISGGRIINKAVCFLAIFSCLVIPKSHAQFTFATDNADNYGGNWTVGSDGGSGFGGWGFATGASSGSFLGNPSNNNISNTAMGTTAFGMFAGGTEYANRSRGFDVGMGIGDIFTFDWGMNWDANGGSKGFDLKAGGTSVLNINNGGSSAITVNGVAANANYGTGNMAVTLTRTASGYTFSMTSRSGGAPYSVNIATSSTIDNFNYYIGNQNNGFGERNMYFDNLLIRNDGVFNQGGAVNNANRFTGTGNLSVGNNTTLALTGPGNNNYTGTTTIGSGSTLRFEGAGTSDFASAISGAGSVVINNGAGVLNLTGNNSGLTGAITVSSGILEARNANSLGSTAAGTTVASGGTLKIFSSGAGFSLADSINIAGVGVGSGIGAINNTGGDNTLTGTVTLAANTRINADTTGSSGSLTIGGNISGGANVLYLGAQGTSGANTGGNIIVSGAISGAGATDTSITSVFKDGAGTLTLSGANNYTGDTRIAAGNLTVSGSGTLGTGSDIFIGSGGSLSVNVNTSVASLQEWGTSNAGTVSIGTGATLTVNGVDKGTMFQNSISGAGGLTMDGSGTSTLSLYGTQGYTGTTTVSGGKISSGFALASSEIRVSGGTFETSAANIVADTSAVNMSSGTYALGGNDTVASLTVSGGLLSTANGSTLTAATYALNGGTVSANLGAGTVNASSGTTLLSGTSAAANVNVSGGLLSLVSADRLANGAAVAVSSGELAVGADDTVGSLSTTGGTVSGAGTLTAATYALNGGTVSANLGAGTVNATSGTTLLSGTSAAANVNVSGGILNTSGADKLADGAAVAVSSGTLGVGGNDTVGSLVASGTGAVTVASSTTLTANGNSSITGSARATGGTVAVANNSLLNLANDSRTTTSNLSIGSGSTLAGTGGTSGQIKGSGLLSPGNSPGILTSGSVDLTGGMDFAFEFTAAGAPTYSVATNSKNDLLHLTSESTPFSGPFTTGNTVSFYFNDAGLSASLASVTTTTYLGGFFVDSSSFDIAGLLSNATKQYFIAAAGGSTTLNGVSYNLMSNEVADRIILSNVNQSGADFTTGTVNGTVLGVTAVPEPSSGSLLLAGIGSLLVLRRFRKKA